MLFLLLIILNSIIVCLYSVSLYYYFIIVTINLRYSYSLLYTYLNSFLVKVVFLLVTQLMLYYSIYFDFSFIYRTYIYYLPYLLLFNLVTSLTLLNGYCSLILKLYLYRNSTFIIFLNIYSMALNSTPRFYKKPTLCNKRTSYVHEFLSNFNVVS